MSTPKPKRKSTVNPAPPEAAAAAPAAPKSLSAVEQALNQKAAAQTHAEMQEFHALLHQFFDARPVGPIRSPLSLLRNKHSTSSFFNEDIDYQLRNTYSMPVKQGVEDLLRVFKETRHAHLVHKFTSELLAKVALL